MENSLEEEVWHVCWKKVENKRITLNYYCYCTFFQATVKKEKVNNKIENTNWITKRSYVSCILFNKWTSQFLQHSWTKQSLCVLSHHQEIMLKRFLILIESGELRSQEWVSTLSLTRDRIKTFFKDFLVLFNNVAVLERLPQFNLENWKNAWMLSVTARFQIIINNLIIVFVRISDLYH